LHIFSIAALNGVLIKSEVDRHFPRSLNGPIHVRKEPGNKKMTIDNLMNLISMITLSRASSYLSATANNSPAILVKFTAFSL